MSRRHDKAPSMGDPDKRLPGEAGSEPTPTHAEKLEAACDLLAAVVDVFEQAPALRAMIGPKLRARLGISDDPEPAVEAAPQPERPQEQEVN